MVNICMTVAYDGSAYCGFQTQPNNDTIQGRLESAIKHLTGEVVKITASGRTDAGVHARGQVFNFYTASTIPIHRWCMALNTRLPDNIRVLDACIVSDDFHSRRTAKRKTYRYTLRYGKYYDPMKKHMEFHYYGALDLEAMRSALAHFVGVHDFTSFCSARTNTATYVRTIFEARLELEAFDECLQSQAIHIYLTGSGFLYNMVRIIVGTLLQVGEGKRSPDSMKEILVSRNRKLAGPTAMAHGLMLWEVYYGDNYKKLD
ncbi:tRNA pseudouridine(38-40) synthase TruA [Paenibacillus sp. YYML68]|uniref:tRNA pseudouridine(38-40) synthase TruA n=1 Tax=Paenibacillus sp. YYML68 TaxID=2909250 RepID=UPI002490AED5|nr:tRNA pseudouridine(38-40) synthase TruA [Paenibacillus sp. YYML68]